MREKLMARERGGRGEEGENGGGGEGEEGLATYFNILPGII